MSKIVTAMFAPRGAAEFILRSLDRAGFTKNQVMILGGKEARVTHFDIDTLIRMGIPAYEANLYEEKIRKGAILIVVKAADDVRTDRAKSIMEDANTLSVISLAA